MFNLLRPLLIIGFLVPWVFIYIWTTKDLNEWTAIGIGLGQFACIVILLVGDDIWMVNYKKNNRKLK